MAKYICLNGELLLAEDAKVSVADHGLLVGDGVFETLRTIGGKLFRFEEHYQRLLSSAEQILLPIPVDAPTLLKNIEDLISANQIKEARVRVTVTRGVGPAGLSIECKDQAVIVTAEELVTFDYASGVKVITYEMQRNLPTIKSLSYLPSVVAKAYAGKAGAFESILIDEAGFAREGALSNFFMVKDQQVITPIDKVLIGITRQLAIDRAMELGFEIIQRDIKKAELYEADELFLTFTTGGVVPVIQVDQQILGVGKITEQLRKNYNSFCSAN